MAKPWGGAAEAGSARIAAAQTGFRDHGIWGKQGAISPLSPGEDAAGNAKSPIDRIGRFVIVGLDQAS
jgi:hypothetical protein